MEIFQFLSFFPKVIEEVLVTSSMKLIRILITRTLIGSSGRLRASMMDLILCLSQTQKKYSPKRMRRLKVNPYLPSSKEILE